jgi:hypothetical protein
MPVVVDTNVAKVASGHAPQADDACVNTCVQRLNEITQTGGLLLDELGLILNEYIMGLGHAGQPGAGEKFVKWAWDNQCSSEFVRKIAITQRTDHGWRRFDEFPDRDDLSTFDKSDQKFVAVTLASGERPAILNAVDSDWWNHLTALTAAGITVVFLCPQHAPIL